MYVVANEHTQATELELMTADHLFYQLEYIVYQTLVYPATFKSMRYVTNGCFFSSAGR